MTLLEQMLTMLDNWEKALQGEFPKPTKKDILLGIEQQTTSAATQLDENNWKTFYKKLTKKIHRDQFANNYPELAKCLGEDALSKPFLFLKELNEKRERGEKPTFEPTSEITSYTLLMELLIAKGEAHLSPFILESPNKIAALFTTHTEFMAFAEKASKLSYFLIKEAAGTIVTIFKNYAQFMEFLKANKLLANSLCSHAPNEMANLLTTHTQFLELAATSSSAALWLAKAAPVKIINLCKNAMQFIDVAKNAPSIHVYTLLNNKPLSIVALFTTPAQFIKLATDCHLLMAIKLIEADPDKIASLFTTHDEYNRLIKENSYLAKLLLKKAPDKIAHLVASPSGQSSSSKVDDSSSHTSSSSVGKSTPPTPGTPTSTPPLTPKVSPKSPKEPVRNKSNNNSWFILKLLSGLAVLGGIALLVLAILLAQPEMIAPGIIVLGLGVIGLFAPGKKASFTTNQDDSVPSPAH